MKNNKLKFLRLFLIAFGGIVIYLAVIGIISSLILGLVFYLAPGFSMPLLILILIGVAAYFVASGVKNCEENDETNSKSN